MIWYNDTYSHQLWTFSNFEWELMTVFSTAVISSQLLCNSSSRLTDRRTRELRTKHESRWEHCMQTRRASLKLTVGLACNLEHANSRFSIWPGLCYYSSAGTEIVRLACNLEKSRPNPVLKNLSGAFELISKTRNNASRSLHIQYCIYGFS